MNGMKVSSVLAAAFFFLFTMDATAQSLGGSPASMSRQQSQAFIHDLSFMESAARIGRFVAAELLVELKGNRNYDLHDVSYPYGRPAVKLFVERLAEQFRSACGETLIVTSLTRPLDEQPSNAHDESVHPTGMAVDLRVPGSGRCREWLNSVLLSLEGTGVLEATRERSPAHYHIAIFPEQYDAYVRNLRADIREYIVLRGDALARIARTNGTTVSALTVANGISGDRIYPGQVLRIPN
jgi:hypothetical protein